jgi:hypothetical protein
MAQMTKTQICRPSPPSGIILVPLPMPVEVQMEWQLGLSSTYQPFLGEVTHY